MILLTFIGSSRTNFCRFALPLEQPSRPEPATRKKALTPIRRVVYLEEQDRASRSEQRLMRAKQAARAANHHTRSNPTALFIRRPTGTDLNTPQAVPAQQPRRPLHPALLDGILRLANPYPGARRRYPQDLDVPPSRTQQHQGDARQKVKPVAKRTKYSTVGNKPLV